MQKSSELIGLAKSSLVALKSLRTTCYDKIGHDFNPFENSIDSKSLIDEVVVHPLEKIVMGIEDAEVILTFMDHLDVIEGNVMKLNSMILRLSEENSWLREEITASHNKLSEAEEKNIELENIINDYKLKIDLIKYEEPMTQSYSSTQLADSINLSESTISGQLTEETYCDNSTTKRSANQNSNQSESNQTQSTNDSGGYNYELPDHLKTLHSLITEYSSKGRYEVAIALCKQAIENEKVKLESRKRILRSDAEEGINGSESIEDGEEDSSAGCCSLDIATLQNMLALVYRDQGNYVQAGELLNKSLTIREKILGPNHPLIAITLNNIAIIHAKTGKLREAECMCKRALAIREQNLGTNHPDVAKQLFNLALLVQNQGRYEDVEQYYKKALSIYADKYGPDNFNVMKTRNNIAYVHLKQNNFVQAEIIFKELLTCWHERLSDSSATSDDNTNDNGPKKPLWVLVEDRNLFGNANFMKNSTDIRKLLPVYTRVTELSKEEFDLFSSSVSYLIRAYRNQNKSTEASLLEEWLSQSIKYFDSMEQICRQSHRKLHNHHRGGGTVTNSNSELDAEHYYPFDEPFSPIIQSTSRTFLSGNTSLHGSVGPISNNNQSNNNDSPSRYSIRRISNRISNTFRNLRSQGNTSIDNGVSHDYGISGSASSNTNTLNSNN